MLIFRLRGGDASPPSPRFRRPWRIVSSREADRIANTHRRLSLFATDIFLKIRQHFSSTNAPFYLETMFKPKTSSFLFKLNSRNRWSDAVPHSCPNPLWEQSRPWGPSIRLHDTLRLHLFRAGSRKVWRTSRGTRTCSPSCCGTPPGRCSTCRSWPAST